MFSLILIIISLSKRINRNVVLSNLLLKNNRIKLCDFGVSRMRSIESTIELSTRVGTLCYMSPELRNNEAYGENTDIW